MASLVSTTVSGDLKVTGSSNLFFEGSASSHTFEPGTRIYGAGVTLTGGAYTSVFEYTVPAGLAGNFRFFVKGTTGNVVIPTQVDVLLNHSKDITIKSQSGNYTTLHVKVLTNDNEDCLVQIKADTHNNANVTVYIDVIAFGDGSVSFSSFGSYTGTYLEHNCVFGFAFSSINGTASTARFVLEGNSNGRLGVGTDVVNTDVEVSKSSTTTGPVIRLTNRNNSISAGGTHGAIEFFSGDNSNPADQVVSSIKSIHVATAPNYGELAFSTGSNSEAVRINLSGNVGIGTTNPSARLDLHAGNMLIGDSYLDHHSSNDNYGLQIKSIDATQAALELRCNGGSNAAGTWRATFYGAASAYGFLDGPWGNWDIKKNVDGALQIDQGSGLETVLTTATGMSSSTAWANMGAGTRTNYTLKFQPPASSYAGFQFMGTNSANAGFFLIRGTSDSDVYTAEGITLVADQGWLTLAQRTASSRGVKIMTGSSTSRDRVTVSTAGDIVLGVPTNSLGTATTTTLKGYSVQYDSGGAGARLSNTGFLTWHTGGSWTSNERMWAFTNAYNISGSAGPRFTLLRGNANNVVPTLGNNGSFGTNTLLTCYWSKDGDFHNAGPVSIVTQTLPTSNKFHVSSGSSGSASKSSIAVVSVANNSTFNNGNAALHVINSGNRGTKGNSIGSDLLRLEFSNGIHTIFDKEGNVGIGTTSPGKLLQLEGGGLRLPNGYSIDWNNENTRILASHASQYIRMDIAGTSNVMYATPTYVSFNREIIAGNASTTGGSWLEKNYSGSNKLNVLSSKYSSGNTIIGYGAKGKSGSGGYVATYGNFSGNKSVIELSASTLYFKVTDSAAQDTIGDDITLNQRLAVDKDSMTFTSSAGAGLTVNRTSNSAYLQFYPAYSSVPTIMGKGAGGLHLGYNSNTSGIRIDTSNNVIIKDNILFFGSTAGPFVSNDSTVLRLAGDGGVKLQTYVSGWQDRLTIIDNGNVGIGTTQPSQKLDVNGNTELNGSVNVVGGGWISFDGEQGLRKSGNWLYLADGGFSSGLYTRIKIRVDGYDISPYQNTANVTSATTLGISTKRWHNVYSQSGNFGSHVTLAGDATSILYFGAKRALEGQIANNNLDLGENFGNIRMRSSSDVFPTNTVDLGTSSNRWDTIYGSTANFNGSGQQMAQFGNTSARCGIEVKSSQWCEVFFTNASYANSARIGMAYDSSHSSSTENGDWYVYQPNVARMDIIVRRTGNVILCGAGGASAGKVGIGTTNPSASLHVGNSTTATEPLRLQKSDDNVSNHVTFYSATTRVGEIGCQDTTWLRINQVTNKNIYTPRMIRVDGGIQVDGSYVITGGGIHAGSGAQLTSLNGSNIGSGTVPAARLGSGSSITTKFLRGDNTWQTVTSGGGTITGVTVGTGLDGGGSSGSVSIDLDLSEFTDMTADITTTDEVILLDAGAERRKAFGELKLSKFNNDSGWTSNTGDITAVTVGTGLDGGGTSGSVSINLDLSEFTDMTSDITTSDEVILLDSGAERKKSFGELKLSKFNNDSGWTSNSGDITAVTAGTGLSGGGTSGSVTVNLANTTVTAGSYTNTNITVDAQGRITAASNGSGGGGGGDITAVTAGNGLTGGGTSGAVTLNVAGSTGIDVAADSISVDSGVCMSIYTSSNFTTSNANSRSFTFAQGGSLVVTGDGYSTITFSDSSSSDYRIKKNISTFNSEAWTKVKSVNVRKFDFNDLAKDAEPGLEGRTDVIGFIAHELAEAGIEGAVEGEKDAVDGEGNAVYQKICQVKLIPVMWGALNEALNRIETLETKVKSLEDSS